MCGCSTSIGIVSGAQQTSEAILCQTDSLHVETCTCELLRLLLLEVDDIVIESLTYLADARIDR